jgi:NitT/TauT family transport system ATP-binding protein
MTIKVNQLTKSFDGKKVLNNLTVTLEGGRVTSLMGASGSGKTTLANILLGLLQPDSGTIEGLTGKKLSAVFQEDRLCEQLNALENIYLILKKEIDCHEIMKQLEAVGLDDGLGRKPVHQLSGGQKRRVAILRAMIAESDFICLDEPFKGLDKETKEKSMAYVKKAIEGKTVLLITHDVQEADYFGGTRIELLPEFLNGIQVFA